MTTGRYFGSFTHRPCPACGSPRVLFDYDDDARIEPGTVETVECRHRDGRRLSEAEAKEAAKAPCPKCGGTLVVFHGSDRWGNQWYFLACRTQYSGGRRFHALPGCDRCREMHSHAAVGLTAAD